MLVLVKVGGLKTISTRAFRRSHLPTYDVKYVAMETKVSLEEVEDIETALQLDDEIEVMIISDENEMGQVRRIKQIDRCVRVAGASVSQFA